MRSLVWYGLVFYLLSEEVPGDGQRTVSEHRCQGCQHRLTLFAHGAQITPDAAKGGDTSFTAKGTRDLLLNFDHPQIPFCLIIRKWDGQVVQKSQYLVG